MAFCSPTPSQSEATFKLRLSEYPALQAPLGSVRLGINPVRSDDFPFGNFWPILINRDEDGILHVLDAECRHASCVVPAYEPADLGMRCRCHGSLYAIDGTVLAGPAEQPLWKHRFEFDGQDTLTIHIPCWGFSAQLSVLAAGAQSRVRLDFPTFPQVTYEVRFRETSSNEWAVVPFALTPDGEANQSSLLATGSAEKIYVDRNTASGFYAVAMQLSEV